MAGRDHCYMHLMYVGNIDAVSAQMSKVHSYVATLFLVSQRLMPPHWHAWTLNL